MRLLEKADLFNKLTKAAAIRENMAKRIFISLLSRLVPETESARIHLTKGIIDHNVLKELLPGAKELLEYGAKICIDELKTINSFFFISEENTHVANQLRWDAERLSNKNDFIGSLKISLEAFNTPRIWETAYGGKPWVKIASTLLEIGESINTYYSSNEDEVKIEALKNLLVYMNVLDGLSHNSAEVIGNFINKEKEQGSYSYEKNYNEKRKYKDDITRLLNSKQLENSADVWNEIKKYISPTVKGRKVKQQGYLADWVDIANKLPITDYDEREKELNYINMKKSLEKDVNHYINLWNKAKTNKVLFKNNWTGECDSGLSQVKTLLVMLMDKKRMYGKLFTDQQREQVKNLFDKAMEVFNEVDDLKKSVLSGDGRDRIGAKTFAWAKEQDKLNKKINKLDFYKQEGIFQYQALEEAFKGKDLVLIKKVDDILLSLKSIIDSISFIRKNFNDEEEVKIDLTTPRKPNDDEVLF